MKIQTWLKIKRAALVRTMKKCDTMLDKQERGESIPYGTDWGASYDHCESQLDLIDAMLKRIKGGMIDK